MQTLLIASKNKQEIDDFLLKFYKENNISNFDIHIIEKEGSIGIGEVREIQKSLFLKPVSGETKAVVLLNSQNLTIEAQNALLKILEEPPSSAFIILTANKAGSFLPTIISRCKIIEFNQKSPDPLENDVTETLSFLETLIYSGVGEKLKLAQEFGKDKEELTSRLDKIIATTRYFLLEKYIKGKNFLPYSETSNNVLLKIIKNLQKTRNILSATNTNPRLVLENTFLNIS